MIKFKGLNIIVVEDDAVISQLIETDLIAAGHTVLDIIHRADKVISSISKHAPDLVLLDIDLGGTMDGIDIGHLINNKHKVPFIYITAFSDRNTLERAKHTLPCGYVVKPYKPVDLSTAIEIGMFNFRQRAANKELTVQQLNKISVEPLTKKEFEIVQEITQGLTNAQIASNQFLSLNTIKWHLQNIYSKIGVKNRTSLVKLALDGA